VTELFDPTVFVYIKQVAKEKKANLTRLTNGVSRIDDESRAQTQTPGDCYNTALAQGRAGNKQWRRKPDPAGPGVRAPRETWTRTKLTSFIRYTVLASHIERQVTTELDFRCVYYSPAIGGGD